MIAAVTLIAGVFCFCVGRADLFPGMVARQGDEVAGVALFRGVILILLRGTGVALIVEGLLLCL